MRRIGRWMLNALTALSVVLCVVTCVLWVRSYYRADILGVWWTSHSALGGWVVHGLSSESYQGTVMLYMNRSLELSISQRWGVSHYSYSSFLYHPRGAPHAVVACVLALLPAHRLHRWRARRRAREQGLCLNCSYNLTGNVSGVCPECGRKIAEAK